VSVFIDTSALFALLDADDDHNARAVATFPSLDRTELVTTSYVVVECTALVERRLGRDLARALLRDVLATTRIVWVDEPLHRAAASAYLAARRMDVSLVDYASFEVMRREKIARAFVFDRHFADAGFDVIPG
jgi:predicted nucleic acid-binding protein